MKASNTRWPWVLLAAVLPLCAGHQLTAEKITNLLSSVKAQCALAPKAEKFLLFSSVSSGEFRLRNAAALRSKRCYAHKHKLQWVEDRTVPDVISPWVFVPQVLGRIVTAGKLACRAEWLVYMGADWRVRPWK